MFVKPAWVEFIPIAAEGKRMNFFVDINIK